MRGSGWFAFAIVAGDVLAASFYIHRTSGLTVHGSCVSIQGGLVHCVSLDPGLLFLATMIAVFGVLAVAKAAIWLRANTGRRASS